VSSNECDQTEKALGDVAVDRGSVVWMVSELATNAVFHAQTEFTLSIRVDPLPVRIEIRDWCVTGPFFGAPGPT
jgi:anti-sigma regulatory factor (Ser/Thr protein kinase)